MKLVLASASPRRREILKNAGFDFEVLPVNADEKLPDGISPEEAVKYLANLKGDAAARITDGVIVSADTIVSCGGKILGKPESKEEACEMLRMLSGKTHEVFTGVCIQKGNKKSVFSEKTQVTFFYVSDEEIERYVETGEPMDKAGAYGIQGKGALLVEKINGDYFNVVGLPVARFARELRDFYGQN